MRALVLLLVLSTEAVADPPRRYKCDDFDEVREECICEKNFKPARDAKNNAVCVRAGASWPRLWLVDPVPIKAVEPSALFQIQVSGPAVDGLEVEFCADRACTKRSLNFKQAVVSGVVEFRLAEPPQDSDMYWRARAYRGASFGPRTQVQGFHTKAQPSRVSGIDLDAIDQLIAARQFSEVVAVARTSKSAADHLEIALRLAKANHCLSVLEVVGLTHSPSKDQRAQLGQLAIDCDAAATNQQIIATVDAGDLAAGQAAREAYLQLHPEHMTLIFWSEAYLAVKRSPPDCETARNRVVLATSEGVIAPERVKQMINEICPAAEEPTPSTPSPSDFAAAFAGVDYELPWRGERTREGLRYNVGWRGHIGRDQMTSGGIGVAALRPFQAGIDGRLGASWGLLGMVSAGSREPASFGVRFDFEGFTGRGKYFVDGGQHSCLVMDALVGVTFRKRLVPHLYLAIRGGVRVGYLVDFADQRSDTYVDRFLERWHGTLSFDAGISLQVR